MLVKDNQVNKKPTKIPFKFENDIYVIDFSQIDRSNLSKLKIKAEMWYNNPHSYTAIQLFRQSFDDTETCLFDACFYFD